MEDVYQFGNKYNKIQRFKNTLVLRTFTTVEILRYTAEPEFYDPLEPRKSGR